MGIMNFLNEPIWTFSRWGIFALIFKSVMWTLVLVGTVSLVLYLRRRRINPFNFRRWNWAWLGGGIAVIWRRTGVRFWNWLRLARFGPAFMAAWRAGKAAYTATAPAPTTTPTPAPAPTTPTPPPAPRAP